MKYLVLFSLFLSLTVVQASERERLIIEKQREKLTALSYKTRESALEILQDLARKVDSVELKIEIVDALQEQIFDFGTGGTAAMSLELIEQIAKESNELAVAVKAIEILEMNLAFSLSQSARMRITAAKSMVSIADSFEDSKLNEMVYDAFLPHADTRLDQLSKIVKSYLTRD